MRERAFVTATIWIGLLIAVGQMVNEFTYNVYTFIPSEVQNTNLPFEQGRTITEVVVLPEMQTAIITILMMMLIIGAIIATVAIWRNAPAQSTSAQAQEARANNTVYKAVQQAGKAKRVGVFGWRARQPQNPAVDPAHQERVMRLAELLDEEEIAYLEARRDHEQLSRYQ